jgi:hypothetical protein
MSNPNATKRFELLQNEYIEWCLTDKHQRAVMGLPSSDVEWAKVKGISDRTIRQWKQNEKFIAKYENRQKEIELSLPGATALATSPKAGKATRSASPGSVSGDDSNDYNVIKNKLVERAMSGDRASAELYFKTYGKLYVDEEAASRRSDFRDADVDFLYERVLTLVPLDKIEAELEKRKAVVE